MLRVRVKGVHLLADSNEAFGNVIRAALLLDTFISVGRLSRSAGNAEGNPISVCLELKRLRMC